MNLSIQMSGAEALAPGVRALAPEVRALAPGVRALAPGVRVRAPGVRALAPEVRALAPEVRACGCASSLPNTCKNACSINAAFKNTMCFYDLPPKHQFCCGVVTHTCQNRLKHIVFTRIFETSGSVVSKHYIFTMTFTCKKYPVLSLFFRVRKP